MTNNKFIGSTLDFIATVLMSSLLVGFIAFYFFNSYLDNQTAKAQQIEALLTQQQKLIADAQADIALLKTDSGGYLAKAQQDYDKELTRIKQQSSNILAEQQQIINELKLPAKYTQADTNLIATDSNKVLRSVSVGTRVTVYSENGQYSTVKVGSQQGRVLTQYLADNAPSSVVPDLSVIVQHWRPNMAYIICDFKSPDTGKLYLEKTGSGTVFQINSGYTVITNKHVLSDEKTGATASSCNFKFPGSTHVFNIQASAITTSPNIDWGMIQVIDLTNYINVSTISKLIRCSAPQDGEEVAIIGYPEIGSQTDITTTRGIISGRDGNFYITDAKIDYGNSGGAAVLIKSNCYLGIPTFAVVGGVESLGRILDAKVVFGK